MTRSNFTKEYTRLRKMLVGVRRASSLTQAQVARRLKRPQSFVSKYERGERRLDVIEFLEVLHALETDPLAFLAQFRLNT